MTLEVHAPLDALVNDAVHPVTVLIDTHKVHDLSDANHIVHIQNLAHLFSTKGRAGAFQLQNGGNAGGSQHILPQGRFLGVAQHEADALHTHHVTDLMRIGADGGAPGEDGSAPVFIFQLSQCLPLHISKNRSADVVITSAVTPAIIDANN